MNTTTPSLTKVRFSNNLTKQVLFVLFFFLIITFSAKMQAENIIQCPDFECDSYATNWNSSLGAESSLELSTTAHSGSKSMKLISQSSTTIYQVITGIKADQKYNLSVYLKNPSSNGAIQVNLQIRFYRNNSAISGSLTSEPFTIDAGGDWELKSVAAIAPSNANRVRVYIETREIGTFLVDDVSLEEANSITKFSDIFKAIGDDDFELTATSNSGNPISYAIADPSIASITGSTIHILATGKTTLTATEGDADPVTVNFIVKEDGSRGIYYRLEDFSTAADGWYSRLANEGLFPVSMSTDFLATSWSTPWIESVVRVKSVDEEDADAAFLKHGKNSLLILPATGSINATTISTSLSFSEAGTSNIFSEAKKITIWFAGSQSTTADFEALAPNPSVGYENLVVSDFTPSIHSYELAVSNGSGSSTLRSPQYSDQGVWHKWEIDLVAENLLSVEKFTINSSVRGTADLRYGAMYGEIVSRVFLGMPIIIGAIIVDWDLAEAPVASGFYPQNLQAQTISGFPDINVTVGEKVKLDATVESGEEVFYLIDEVNGIATLANGDSVVGLAAGETTLTAIQAGTSEYASIIKTVKLTVNTRKQAQNIENFSNISESYTEGKTITLAATANTGITYTVETGKEQVATITGNIITLKGVGSIEITATASESTEYSSATKTITLIVSPGASIGETEGNSTFSLVENPVKDEARFTFESAGNDARIVISDLTGKPVAGQAVEVGATEASILVSHLSSGVYVAHYTDNNGKVSTVKFIK